MSAPENSPASYPAREMLTGGVGAAQGDSAHVVVNPVDPADSSVADAVVTGALVGGIVASTVAASGTVASSRTVRLVWFGIGWVNVGVGSAGVVLPVLPSTIFFIVAAYSFSRSSPRFERWVLNLPGVGPLVRDYRDGLGMPRKAKIIAISSVVFFGSISTFAVSSRLWLSALVAALCLTGILYILFLVPLREKVLAQREAAGIASGSLTVAAGDETAMEQLVVIAVPLEDPTGQLDS